MKSETSPLTILIGILFAPLGFSILGKMIQTKFNDTATKVQRGF